MTPGWKFAAVSIILLLIPFSTLLAGFVPSDKVAAKTTPALPSLSAPISLTNSSYDHQFLPSLADGRPVASGGVIAWANSSTSSLGYPTLCGVYDHLGYSSLNPSSGRLVAKDLAIPLGYKLPPSCIGYGGADEANVALEVLRQPDPLANLSGGQKLLLFNANDGSSSVVDCPDQNSEPYQPRYVGTCGYGTPLVSTWGSYMVALKSYNRLFAKNVMEAYEWYKSTEVAQATGAGWTQLTPSNYHVISKDCSITGQSYQRLVVLNPVSKVLARGPGQYAYQRLDTVNPASVSGCSNLVLNGDVVGESIRLESGEVAAQLYPTGTFQGMPCSSDSHALCYVTLLGAWGNIVLFAVHDSRPSATHAFDFWVYDSSLHSTTHLPLVSHESQMQDIFVTWSDGRSLIMRNATAVEVYDARLSSVGGARLFKQAATFARVSGGWAFWLNSTGGVNLFDIAQQKLYSEDIIQGAASGLDANFPVTVDFSDGVAAWVTVQLTGLRSQPKVPVLYVLDAAHADPSTGNLTQATAKLPLTWAKNFTPFGETALTRFRIGTTVVSKSWVFLTAAPMWSNYTQVFAFQPLSGQVGVTVRGSFLPLKEARIEVTQGDTLPNIIASTFTDDYGYFSAFLPQSLSSASPKFMFVVNLTQRDGKFGVFDYSGNPSVSAPHVANSSVTITTGDLSVIKVSDHFVKIDVKDVAARGAMTTTASRVSYTPDDAYNYHLAFQAYSLLRDVLNSGNIIDKTIQVRTFSKANATYFSSGIHLTLAGISFTPHLNLDPRNSVIGNPDEPMNTVWHEFGHAVMWYSSIGGLHSLPKGAATDNNHAGYRNKDSTDSWTEGWAEFYSMMVAHYIDHRPDANLYKCCKGSVYNYDLNFTVASVGDEEDAVAGTLWDLPNLEAIPDRDTAHVPIVQLWQTLESGAPNNLYGVWNLFKGEAGVNQTFIWHDIYNDTNMNGHWNAGEPIGTTSWALVKTLLGNYATTNSTTIKTAAMNHNLLISNSHRANRQDHPVLSGSEVFVNLADLDTRIPISALTATVTIRDPVQSPLTYNYSIPDGTHSFSIILASPSSNATFFVSSPGYPRSPTYAVTGSVFEASVVSANFENNTSYLANLNGTLARHYGTLRNYTIDASEPGNGYYVIVSTGGTISSGAFNPSSATVVFTSNGGPSGSNEIVVIPNALGTLSSLSVGGSQVTPSVSSGKLVTIVRFNVPPSTSSISIKLAAAASTMTSSTRSSSSSLTSTSTTGSGSQTTSGAGGAIPEFPSQILAVVSTIVLTVTYMLFRRRMNA